MNDTQYTTLPQWPNAYPASGASATLKRLNEDFIVTELPLQPPLMVSISPPPPAGSVIWNDEAVPVQAKEPGQFRIGSRP